MGLLKHPRRSRPPPTNTPSRLRHATRRKHYAHVTLQSRILPLYRAIPYSLLVFYNPAPQNGHGQDWSDSGAVFRTRPHFLPCPPPRTANLEWASWVNLCSIVCGVLADAEACVRLWERMNYAERQSWAQARRETLDKNIPRVVYFRRVLEGRSRVENREN